MRGSFATLIIAFENATLAAVGLGSGLGLRLLRSFITDVSPLHPLTLGGTAIVVTGAALAASAWPVLRAARRSPVAVLRDA